MLIDENRDFIRSTSKDYGIEQYIVENYYSTSKDHEEFYSRLEEILKVRDRGL